EEGHGSSRPRSPPGAMDGLIGAPYIDDTSEAVASRRSGTRQRARLNVGGDTGTGHVAGASARGPASAFLRRSNDRAVGAEKRAQQRAMAAGFVGTVAADGEV